MHYSSTSLLSCTARRINSCQSYTKQSAFKTKQGFLFFKLSWSHPASCPGTSSFILSEHSHHHQAHGTAMILRLGWNFKDSYHLEKASGLWCWQTGACAFWTASLLPADLRRQVKESMNYLGVTFSNQLSSSHFLGKQAKHHAEILTTGPSYSVDMKHARAVSQNAGVNFGYLDHYLPSSLLIQSSLSMKARHRFPGECRCLIPVSLGLRAEYL